MRSFYILILFLISSIVMSQSFEVDVSSNVVTINETFTISFSVNQSGKNFSPPQFSDFQIIRGPSKSSSTSIINGDITKEITYSYVLKSKKIGVFTILPASIKVRNKTIGTRPVTIQVKKESSSNSKPNTPYDIVNRKVHLVVSSDKKRCYVGEPVVLTYKLYFNLNVGNLNPQSVTYSNFWTEDVKKINSNTNKEMFKGEQYNAAIVKQIVILPQSHGIQNIDPFSIDMVASVPTSRRDIFGMQAKSSINYTAVSNKLSIEVVPLPKENVPKDFSGSVGLFNLTVEIDKDSLNVNQSASLSVNIEGSGNLNLIKFPEVKFDNELEVYDPKNIDRLNINKTGISGYVKNNYLIVPRHKGEYILKAISFSFFNPKKKKYITLSSNDIKLKVGGASIYNNSETQRSVKKENIDLINEDIKFIKINYEKSFLGDYFFRSNLFYVLLALPFLLSLFIILLMYFIKNNQTLFKISNLRKFKARIKKTHHLLDIKQYAKFQSALLTIMFDYASVRLSIPKSDLSVRLIKEALLNRGVSGVLVKDYIDMINYLEMCRYSEKRGEKLNKDLFNKINTVLTKIESAL